MMHQPWDEYYLRGWGMDPELFRDRMGMLEFEENKAMFNPHDAKKPTDFSGKHPVDFKCQCRYCVRKTTLSMWDRSWLWSIGVSWSKSDVDANVQAGRYEQPRLPQRHSREARRAQEVENLWKA